MIGADGYTVTLTFDPGPLLLVAALVAFVWLVVSWTPGPRLEQTTWGQLQPGDELHDPETGDTWQVQAWNRHTDAWNPSQPPRETLTVESVREDDGMLWRAQRDPADKVLRHVRDTPGAPA